MSSYRLTFVVCAIALIALPLRADAPLTLDDALRIFRTRGFDLLIADASVESARADEIAAAALPNPQLSLSRGTSRGYDPSLCGGCSSVQVGASLADPGALSDLVTRRRALRVAVARAARESTQQTRADVERTLELTVKEQLLAAELAKQSLAYAGETRKLADETLRLVDIRYRAGAVSEADLARAQTQQLEAEQAVDLATQNVATAKALLAWLLGNRDEPADFDVASDLLRPASIGAATEESLLEAARSHRPDLAAASLQVERARSSLDLAKTLRIPDVQPSVQYTAEGHGQNAIQPPTVTFGIATSLPVLYRYRGEMAKAEADIRTQELGRSKIDAQIAADVHGAWASYLGARSRAERAENHLLERAGRARDLVRLQYEKGAASLFEFLDAERTFLATRTESLQALNDYWTAVFQLEQATATELHR